MSDFYLFLSTANEKAEFMEAFPGGNEVHHGKRKGRSSSRTDVNPEVTKTAVYIKNLFMVGS